MAKIIGFEQVTNPEVCFAISFENDSEVERGIELAKIGFSAWGNPEAVEAGEFNPNFNSEDSGWINCAGWSEPSTELLDCEGIKYSLIDVEVDEDGCLVNEEDKKTISWIAV